MVQVTTIRNIVEPKGERQKAKGSFSLAYGERRLDEDGNGPPKRCLCVCIGLCSSVRVHMI